MSAKMVEIPLTASTKINGKMEPKTKMVLFPAFDPELKNLIEFFTPERVFELCLDSWKIEMQQPMRVEIAKEHGMGNGNGLKGVKAAKLSALQQLGVRR